MINNDGGDDFFFRAENGRDDVQLLMQGRAWRWNKLMVMLEIERGGARDG